MSLRQSGVVVPSPWREMSQTNPILYMVNAFRWGLLGVSDVNLRVAYAVMIGAAVIPVAFARHLIEKGVGLRS